MNQVLLYEDDFISQNRVELTGRRCEHLLSVIKANVNDTIKIGLLNGKQGNALVSRISGNTITLEVKPDREPPAALGLRLIIALPRPKMLRRIIFCVTTLGVKEIYIIRTWRVDKSYWDSPVLTDDKLEEAMIEGLEQTRDTMMPVVYKRPLFKPFIEDELPGLMENSRGIVAHPYAANECPACENEHVTLAIGPEGGFIPYEISKLQENGFTAVSIGQRILRVEHVVPVLIGKIKY